MRNLSLLTFCVILHQIVFTQGLEDTLYAKGKGSYLGDSVVTGLMMKNDSRLVPYHIQVLKPDVFNYVPRINFFNSLTGKVSGLNLLRAQGGIESSSRLVFRGNRSLNQNNEPIIVLDGIPLHDRFEMLNLQDFESIYVLSGATAAALYGNRAQNGAIIIETKRGVDAISVGYNTSFMMNYPDPLLEFQRVYGQGYDLQYNPIAQVAWGPKLEGQEVAHWSPDPSQAGRTYSFRPGFELRDLLRRGHIWSSNLNVTGSAGPIRTYFSYGYTDAAGILPENQLTRHQASLRLNTRLNKKLSFDAKVQVITQDLQNPVPEGLNLSNPFSHAYQVPPNISDEDLRVFEYVDDQAALRQNFWLPNYIFGGNPYWYLYRTTRDQKYETLLTMLQLEYQINQHFSLLFRSGLNSRFIKVEERLSNDTYIIAPEGKYSISKSDLSEGNHEALLTFTKKIFSSLKLKSMIGAAARREREEILQSSTGAGLIIPNLFSLENTHDLQSHTCGYRRNVNSVFTSHQLDWKNQFRLELGMRNDWSSSLPVGSRSQKYPYVASSMILSDLIPNPQWIDLIKLRVAYSKTGNDFAPYQLSRKFVNPEDDAVIALENQIISNNLKPESTYSREVGLDLHLFDRRLQIWSTYYHTTTLDHLFPVPLPVSAGAESILQNGGKVQNQGIELTIYINALQRKNAQWEFFLQIYSNKSKVLSLQSGLPSYDLYQSAYHYLTHKEGEPWGQIYSPFGFQRNLKGQIIVNEEGIPITEVRETFVANMSPKWLGGMQQFFRYKKFRLALSLDIRLGGSLLSVTDNLITTNGFSQKSLAGREDKLIFGKNLFPEEIAVTQTGENNNKEILAQNFWPTVGGCCAPVGEAWVKSASNARIRDLSISYIPDLTDFGFMKNIEISLIGENLFFLFNEAKMIDPEVIYDTTNEGVGWEMYSPPPVRSFGMNLKVEL